MKAHHARAHHKAPPPPHRQPPPNTRDGVPPDTDIPCWLPTQASDLGLPQSVQQSLARIILPAYRAFVLEAPGELERTIGNSVVYLSWLELVNQIRLANVVADPTSADGILFDPDKLTDRCLQLMTAKCQAAGLMLKVRVATEAFNRMATPPVRQAFQPDQPSTIRQAFQPDQSPAPLPPFDTIDYFATDSMPPRVPDPVQSPLSDARPAVHPQSESENARSVDQLNSPVRQAFQPDPSSPKSPTKLEIPEDVDQLGRPVASDHTLPEDPKNGK